MKRLVSILIPTLFASSVFAQSHVGDCTKKVAVEKARCERHEKMAEKCGPLKGEAHFVCDREFLLANTLSCKPFIGAASAECEAEVRAFKTCEPKQGREFMKCVKDTTGISPMGH
ncbi:MAG: hypothetical protein ING75_14755 [Rhodocyclaceae bacterium]|nr:hypothetical protein [Rhodocyclaceae bacterium]